MARVKLICCCAAVPWATAIAPCTASALPPAAVGEYYWVDLIGLAVENTEGESFGTVDSLIETGAVERYLIDYENPTGYSQTLAVYNEDGALLGVFTDGDLRRALDEEPESLEDVGSVLPAQTQPEEGFQIEGEGAADPDDDDEGDVDVDEDLDDPLTTATPTLLLSGTADPITPPAYATRAAAGLKQAWLLTGEHQGHGQIAVGCMPEVVAGFVAAAALEDGAAACIDDSFVMPFFLDFGGPAP